MALPLNVLLTIAIGLGMMIALQLFVKKTKLGKAMRAVPVSYTHLSSGTVSRKQGYYKSSAPLATACAACEE